MRRTAVAILTVLLLVGVTACAQLFPRNCPAIGWINTVEIDASVYGDDAFIQLCTDAGCSPAPGETETPPLDLSTPVRGDVDTFQFGMTAPDEVLLRVYGADGALIVEEQHEIGWTHSTDPCGGPSTANPVVVER
ncbi:hypothetical protein [Microbacterium sp. LWH12-1.2]|uniref:hypothetical protein n=1 Tax=Microbacterium sp. LWH12-1.2 TaxID=3135259 RepID=UPI003448797F